MRRGASSEQEWQRGQERQAPNPNPRPLHRRPHRADRPAGGGSADCEVASEQEAHRLAQEAAQAESQHFTITRVTYAWSCSHETGSSALRVNWMRAGIRAQIRVAQVELPEQVVESVVFSATDTANTCTLSHGEACPRIMPIRHHAKCGGVSLMGISPGGAAKRREEWERLGLAGERNMVPGTICSERAATGRLRVGRGGMPCREKRLSARARWRSRTP